MKLRVIKKRDVRYDWDLKKDIDCDIFEPQYFNEDKNRWCECYLTLNLSATTYYTLESCIEVCRKFQENHPEPEVVWTNDQ